MNEMRARLVVSADASQVVTSMAQAEAAIDEVGRSAKTMGDTLARASTTSRQGVRDLVDASTGVGRSMSSAASSAEVFSRALEEQDQRYKALRASIDPAWRAERQFAAAQDELNRALRLGSVEAGEHAQMMRRLETQYERARTAALALDAAQDGVGRTSGALRGQIQNAAFQFQDVAVQIAAGTAASTAFGQQLPQLLGGLGVYGAVAGAAVAVGVPLAAAFLGAGDAAKEAEAALAGLDAALSRVADRLAVVNDKRLEATFGDMTGSVRELSRAMLELDRAAELRALSEVLDSTVDKAIGRGSMSWWFRPLWEPGAEQAAIMERGNYARLTGGRGLSFDDFQTRRQEIDLLAKTGRVEEVAEKVNQLLRDMADGGPLTAMNADLAEMLMTLGDVAVKTAEFEAQFNGSAEGAAAFADVLAEATARQDELTRLTEVRAEAERRLAAAVAARDAAAQASAQAVIDETDRQIAATTDAKNRLEALGRAFADVEQAAGRVAFDRDAQLRDNVGLVRDLLAEARRNVDDLDDADLSRLEAALKALAGWAGKLADETEAVGTGLSRAQVNAYQQYAASRQAGAMIASTDAVQASRELIIRFEGKAEAAAWDVNHQRAGYGSETITLPDGSTRPVTAGMVVTQDQMDRDLDRRIGLYHEELRRIVGPAMGGFTPQQIAAIASIQHNYGSIPDRIRPALQTGDAQLIAQAIAGLAMDYTKDERKAGKTTRPVNFNRRMEEAGMFGDVTALQTRFEADLSARAEGQREAKRLAAERDREAKRRADQDARWRDSVAGELDRLSPSYTRAVAAADRWKAEALAGLDATKAGYAEFAADIEAIYQERLAKAREDDLARQEGWAAGIERGFAELEKGALDWATVSEDLITGWAKGGEDAFVRLVTTGKASMTDLVDFTLEQLARLAWQQAIQPGLNGLLNSAAGAIGGWLGVGSGDPLTAALRGAGVTGVTLPTAHTGGAGIMRTYSAGNRPRSDERLAMLREGETVMTSRMMENTGALVSALAGRAGQGGDAPVLDTRPVIQVINQSSTPANGEVRESRDERGGRQYQLVLSDAVAGALTVPGGRAGRTLQQQFGVRKQGPVR